MGPAGETVALTPSERRILVFLSALLVFGYAVDLLGLHEPDPPEPAPEAETLPPLSESPFRDGRLDLNRADARALESLPGIGPALATRILKYRSENGPFRDLEDLLQVSGIGPKTLGRIAQRVALPSSSEAAADASPKDR